MFNHLAKPLLLDDEAMQGFIREGYITLQSDLPRDYHARMFAALDELEEGGPRGHNNLLPCVPELARVLEAPRVRGALTSILGANYYLHFHRHDHFTFPGDAQPLHKDGDNHSHLAVDGLRRMHRTRFAMLLYYPQDTPLEKGPTGVVPRSHYLPRRALEAARKGMHAASGRYREEIEREFGTKFHYSKEAQALLRAWGGFAPTTRRCSRNLPGWTNRGSPRRSRSRAKPAPSRSSTSTSCTGATAPTPRTSAGIW